MSETQKKPRDQWSNQEFILAHGHEARSMRRPLFLGNLQRPGWTGRIPTYLIWCEACQDRPNKGFTVAHEAGHARRLACSECRTRYEELLPSRRAMDMILNPHRHPWLIAFLLFAALLTAIALR